MIFKRFLWLLGMLFLAICHIFTGRSVFVAMLAAAVILPLCSLILLRIALRNADAEISLPERSGKNEWISAEIHLKGRKLLYALRAQIQLHVANLLTGEASSVKASFTGGEAQISLQSPHSGKLALEIRSVVLYDPLGLFRSRKRIDANAEMLIQPNAFQPIIELQSPNAPDADGDEYSSILPGEDPSELFGIRDYREGDSLRSIHWKLSEKYDRTVVKEMSLPTKNDILLILDNCPTDAFSPKAVDCACDALVSLSQVLADSYIPHQITWFNREIDRMELISIASLDDLIAVQGRLLSARVLHDSEGIAARIVGEDTEFSAGRIMLFAPVQPIHTEILSGEVTVLLPETNPSQAISCLPESMTRWTV